MYSERQMTLWQAYDDVYHAYYYGYDKFRQPDTGTEFNEVWFRTWQEKVITAQNAESRRDPGTRGVDIDEWPIEFWLYYYERMRAAGAPPTVYWTDD